MKHPDRHPRPRGPRPYRIVHEDIHLLVIDKDPGILTVPLPDKWSRNLKELLDDYLTSQKREAIPVHRIDRYTTGLVVFAKNRKAWKQLVAQFRARSPERVYLALVRGEVRGETGTLRHRLELTTDGFRQRVAREGGTEAVTHYRVLERLPGATLLEVRLESGLKNQIRVQFRAFGHPLVGDRHYAAEEAAEVSLKRQALHAWRLGFLHPATGRPASFEAPLARDMERLIERLRKQPPPPPAPVSAGPEEPRAGPPRETVPRASAAGKRPRPSAKKSPPKHRKAPAKGSAKDDRTGRQARRPETRSAGTGDSGHRPATSRTEARPPVEAKRHPPAKPKPAKRKQNRPRRRRSGS